MSEIKNSDILIRPLEESELSEADHIFRLAFGTFLGLPDPLKFSGDADYLFNRWKVDPSATIGAEVDGKLVGSNVATNWGSVGVFGPLTVHPDCWDAGVATKLLEATMEQFEKWGTKLVSLSTIPHSPKHLGLYQKFGFWPRFLTAVMSKPIEAASGRVEWLSYSELGENEQEKWLNDCRELTDSILEGLSVEREIRSVHTQQLGETIILLDDDKKLAGFAVCHCGKGSQAGSNICHVKFGAVRSGSLASRHFGQLLEACEDLTAARQMSRLRVGVNTARHEAYRLVLDRGFRVDIPGDMLGITMFRPNEAGYDREDVYLMDDLR